MAKNRKTKTELALRLFDAVAEKDVAKMKVLITAGADVNFPLLFLDATILHEAVEKSHAGMVRLLLGHGARVDAMNQKGMQPLHKAALYGGGRKAEIVRLLLAAGANPEAKDDMGDTPLMIAAEQGNVRVVELLLEAGADPAARDDAGHGVPKMSRTAKIRAMVEDAIRNRNADPEVRKSEGLAKVVRELRKRMARHLPKLGPRL